VIEDREILPDATPDIGDNRDNGRGTGEKTGVREARVASGRKPAYDSRGREIRARLLVWKQVPEAERPSLRELARQLGTSHQLLSHYLSGLDTWQAEERAKQIRAHAKAEGRPMTLREHLDVIVTPGLFREIEKLREKARRGPLNRHQVQILKIYARKEWPAAKAAEEILQKCRQMTPEEEKQVQALERAARFVQTIERIRRDGERGPLCWQDVERLKYFARRKCAEAKELLRKYQKSAEPRPQVPQ
jgi:transcriptional regulator with XRE-family HTH domain